MAEIYFNLDLTLTEMNRTFDECLKQTLRELGVPEDKVEPEKYSEIFFEFFEDMEPEPRKKTFSKYFEEKNLDSSPAQASKIYREKELKAVKPIEGLSDVLQKLSSEFELGVITAGTRKLQIEKLEKLDLNRFFDDVMITYEEEKSKKEILEELNSKAVYVSNAESDVQKAKEAGIRSIKADLSKPEKLTEEIEEMA